MTRPANHLIPNGHLMGRRALTWMTIRQAARLLGVTPAEIEIHLWQGTFPIPITRIGGADGFRRSDVEGYRAVLQVAEELAVAA